MVAGGKAQPEAKHQGTFRSKAGSLGAMNVQGQGKVKTSAIRTANLFLTKRFLAAKFSTEDFVGQNKCWPQQFCLKFFSAENVFDRQFSAKKFVGHKLFSATKII